MAGDAKKLAELQAAVATCFTALQNHAVSDSRAMAEELDLALSRFTELIKPKTESEAGNNGR